jgi:hypothetical protein
MLIATDEDVVDVNSRRVWHQLASVLVVIKFDGIWGDE